MELTEGLRAIDEYAFAGAKSIQGVGIRGGTSVIGEIHFPSTLVILRRACFATATYYGDLDRICVPGSVVRIDPNALTAIRGNVGNFEIGSADSRSRLAYVGSESISTATTTTTAAFRLDSQNSTLTNFIFYSSIVEQWENIQRLTGTDRRAS